MGIIAKLVSMYFDSVVARFGERVHILEDNPHIVVSGADRLVSQNDVESREGVWLRDCVVVVRALLGQVGALEDLEIDGAEWLERPGVLECRDADLYLVERGAVGCDEPRDSDGFLAAGGVDAAGERASVGTLNSL